MCSSLCGGAFFSSSFFIKISLFSLWPSFISIYRSCRDKHLYGGSSPTHPPTRPQVNKHTHTHTSTHIFSLRTSAADPWGWGRRRGVRRLPINTHSPTNTHQGAPLPFLDHLCVYLFICDPFPDSSCLSKNIYMFNL